MWSQFRCDFGAAHVRAVNPADGCTGVDGGDAGIELSPGNIGNFEGSQRPAVEELSSFFSASEGRQEADFVGGRGQPGRRGARDWIRDAEGPKRYLPPSDPPPLPLNVRPDTTPRRQKGR